MRESEQVNKMKVYNQKKEDSSLSNSFIIANEKGEAVAVDMGVSPSECISFLERYSLTLKKIFLTHGHYSCSFGAAGVAEATGAEIYIHISDAAKLYDPEKAMMEYDTRYADYWCYQKFLENNQETREDILFLLEDFHPCRNYNTVSDGDVIDFSGIPVRVIHTPGHSAGSCVYIIGDYIFTGETICDIRSTGRYGSPFKDSDCKEFRKSIEMLKQIVENGEDYIIMSGYDTNILEYGTNSFAEYGDLKLSHWFGINPETEEKYDEYMEETHGYNNAVKMFDWYDKNVVNKKENDGNNNGFFSELLNLVFMTRKKHMKR